MSLAKWASMFRVPDEEVAAVAREKGRLILEWMRQPYHEEFEKWLEAEASKPIPVVEHNITLIQSAVRANTLREVARHLARLRSNAMAAVQQDQE